MPTLTARHVLAAAGVVVALLGTGCATRASTPVATGDEGAAVPPVHLQLVGEAGAVLQRSATHGARAQWADLCTVPCTGYVPAFGTYRLVHGGTPPGQPFTLPGPPGTAVTLKVADDGRVFTRDSLALRTARADENAKAALVFGFLAAVSR